MTQARAQSRPPRPQVVLTVTEQSWLTPHIVRVTAGGPGFEAFKMNEFTDKYAKLIFIDPALGLAPPYDLEALRAELPQEQWPVIRTYTVRRVDVERQELSIDFVVHGTAGVAAPWAAAAQPGDTLTLMGANGAYAPDPTNDWHLLVGDESAIPAISSALQALPADAVGLVYLETQDPSSPLDVTVPAGVKLVWLERPEPGAQPGLLAEAIRAGDWLPGRVGVFAHGERESMKAVRAALKERDPDTMKVSLSGYWAYGRTEDKFQAEKREPIGQIDT